MPTIGLTGALVPANEPIVGRVHDMVVIGNRTRPVRRLGHVRYDQVGRPVVLEDVDDDGFPFRRVLPIVERDGIIVVRVDRHHHGGGVALPGRVTRRVLEGWGGGRKGNVERY